MKWTQALISDLREQLNAAPHGTTRKLAEELAEQLGVSTATLYRRVDLTNGTKKCERSHEIPSEHIDTIARIKTEPFQFGVKGRLLSTEDAIEIAEQAGEVPEGLLTIATVDRRLRERGYAQQRAYARHEEEYVNQVHQMDFSRSEYFEVAEVDGEMMVKVDGRRGVWEYKNKPKKERLRLWLIGYVDTKSRAYLARYFAATGENLMMATQFLRFAWNRTDEAHPLVHLPETLKLDQGALGKNAAFRDSLKKNLDIRVELAAAKNDRLSDHQSMGKVERRFRTLWQRFELRLAYILKKKNVDMIPLADLNVLVHDYCTKLLKKKHPVKAQSIGEVYRTGLRIRQPKTLQTDVFALLYTEATRRVNAYCEISIDNEYYKVPAKFKGMKVKFYVNPDGELKGSSLDGRESFDLLPVDVENAQGERQHTDTYKEQIGREAAELNAAKLSIVKPASSATQPYVLPAMEQEVDVATPFQKPKPVQEYFEDWDEVKMYVCETYGCAWSDFNDNTKDILRRAFETKRLDKSVIDNLKNVS
jgi:hypothetical protein